MKFEIGRGYSRQEISDALGGQLQDYLPTKDGRVVCGCFKREARWNPDAPTEVVFGPGPRVEQSARLAAASDAPIPVFIFEESGAWQFIGDHRCMGVSFVESLRQAREQANSARGEIAGVLWFEPVAKAA